MYERVLLAAALQQWDRYSVHALAARDVAATLARDAKELHVLSVYDYEFGRLPSSGASGLPADTVARLRAQEVEQTDTHMKLKLAEYVAPLLAAGLPVSTALRVGSARQVRHVIAELASELQADVLVIGSHSKRGLFDVPLGGTARHVSTHAPCPVVMVAPKK